MVLKKDKEHGKDNKILISFEILNLKMINNNYWYNKLFILFGRQKNLRVSFSYWVLKIPHL